MQDLVVKRRMALLTDALLCWLGDSIEVLSFIMNTYMM